MSPLMPPAPGSAQVDPGMMMGGAAPVTQTPGASTDPMAILQQLVAMAEDDQAQLEMQQQMELLELEEAQRQAMMGALQMMLQTLAQDAHVPAGAEAALAPAEEGGGSDVVGAADLMAGLPPGITRTSGQPIPDDMDIPAY